MRGTTQTRHGLVCDPSGMRFRNAPQTSLPVHPIDEGSWTPGAPRGEQQDPRLILVPTLRKLHQALAFLVPANTHVGQDRLRLKLIHDGGLRIVLPSLVRAVFFFSLFLSFSFLFGGYQFFISLFFFPSPLPSRERRCMSGYSVRPKNTHNTAVCTESRCHPITGIVLP